MIKVHDKLFIDPFCIKELSVEHKFAGRSKAYKYCIVLRLDNDREWTVFASNEADAIELGKTISRKINAAIGRRLDK